MYILFLFFVFIFGAAIGSFLNVVILRTHIGKTLGGRSECPDCHHQLSTPDLIPILSYLLLSGKCRYCRHKLSIQYPLVELSTAILFTLAFLVSSQILTSTLNIPNLLSLIFNLFIVSVLIVITVTDLRWGIIPDNIVLPASLVVFVYQIVLNFFLTPDYRLFIFNLAAALGIGLFFLLLILVTKGKGMGGGDLKLSIFIGLALGWPLAILAIFLGFLTGAIGSVMLLILGKKGLKSSIPFGPFLALGALLVMLLGRQVLEIYFKTLGF